METTTDFSAAIVAHRARQGRHKAFSDMVPGIWQWLGYSLQVSTAACLAKRGFSIKVR